jgi:hypothetical protein
MNRGERAIGLRRHLRRGRPVRSLLVNVLLRPPFSAVMEGLVDRLVTQMPRRPVRVGLAQVRRDLRRTPLLSKLVLHDLA